MPGYGDMDAAGGLLVQEDLVGNTGGVPFLQGDVRRRKVYPLVVVLDAHEDAVDADAALPSPG